MHAEYFGNTVRYMGMLPNPLEDKWLVTFFNITDLVISPRFGAWKITQVNFEDGSYYNVGQPDQGPHVEGDFDVQQED